MSVGACEALSAQFYENVNALKRLKVEQKHRRDELGGDGQPYEGLASEGAPAGAAESWSSLPLSSSKSSTSKGLLM